MAAKEFHRFRFLQFLSAGIDGLKIANNSMISQDSCDPNNK